MKILLCLLVCFAAAQATLIRSSVTYAAPYTTYSAGVVRAPAVYAAPVPLTYTTGHVVSTAYAAPIIVAPSVHATVVKKEFTLG